MRRILVLASLLFYTENTTIYSSVSTGTPKVEYVLICNSSSSYAYHKYECRGLAHCRHGESRVTMRKQSAWDTVRVRYAIELQGASRLRVEQKVYAEKAQRLHRML